MVLVESPLEEDYCFHLEADASVLRYFPQPKTFVVSGDYFKTRNYTPDFEVHFQCGRMAYVEVKKDFESLDEIYLHKLHLVSIEMKNNGYEFLHVDETQIRMEPLLSNLRKLQRYRDRSIDSGGFFTLLRNSVPGPTTLNDLINNPLGIQLDTIYKLVASGHVVIDLSKDLLTVNSGVRYVK
tara:strand:- start:5828 stop:6373 length:546 start_codon:yes stop_codon:yes gene_type:complete